MNDDASKQERLISAQANVIRELQRLIPKLEERVKELEGAYKTCPACGKAWVKP